MIGRACSDLSDNQVIVFTDWTGRPPQEVEDHITYPLTLSQGLLPGVRVIRSSSAFGFSMVNLSPYRGGVTRSWLKVKVPDERTQRTLATDGDAAYRSAGTVASVRYHP
jgi:hypothetical protein